jgi:hypothetical protein
MLQRQGETTTSETKLHISFTQSSQAIDVTKKKLCMRFLSYFPFSLLYIYKKQRQQRKRRRGYQLSSPLTLMSTRFPFTSSFPL